MSRHRRNSGFTLIELLVVVVIIGILASIAIPKFQSMKLNAQAARIISDFRTIAGAAYTYYAETGMMPDDYYPEAMPDELEPYLPDGFKFNLRPEIDARYDWENWSGEGGPTHPHTGTIYGLSVTTRDEALVLAIERTYAGEFHYTLGNNFTFVLQAISE